MIQVAYNSKLLSDVGSSMLRKFGGYRAFVHVYIPELPMH